MEHLTAQDWNELQALFPTAFYFLLHRSLMRERLWLGQSPDTLNEWQKRRLEELNTLHEINNRIERSDPL